MEKPTLQWAFLTYRMSAGGGVKPTYPTANVPGIVVAANDFNRTPLQSDRGLDDEQPAGIDNHRATPLAAFQWS